MKRLLVLTVGVFLHQRREHILILHSVSFSQDFEPQEDWQFPDSSEETPCRKEKDEPLFIIPFRLCSKDGCHLKIILIILKNVLTVDASEHHVVDACSALLPYLSGHIIASYIA